MKSVKKYIDKHRVQVTGEVERLVGNVFYPTHWIIYDVKINISDGLFDVIGSRK